MIIPNYFETLNKKLKEAYDIAGRARSKGYDPVDYVESPVARDVADRVEELVGPKGVAPIIRKMIEEGKSRVEIAFEMVEKISKGEIISGSKEELLDASVRCGVGILTEGVLVAPTEGISKIAIEKNPDGSEYASIYYAGPIRSAGGTVAALSALLADKARKVLGLSDYRPTESEIERYVEEVNVYDSRCHRLQYKPPDEKVRIIVQNCPVCINGDPTEDVEVSVHRDIPRIPSNRVRGGVPLVLCEGIALKSLKILKYSKKLNMGWEEWVQKIVKVKTKQKTVEIKPDYVFLDGLVAGRPVFAYPSAKGGFALRYGHSRTNGLMARNVHPATMILLDEFLANGTHMKVERPGKGTIITGCTNLDSPVVLLQDGTVLKVRTLEEAKKVKPKLKEILFLGEILITYGDFLKSNHPLMPGSYCVEWWSQEVLEKGIQPINPTTPEEAFEFSANNSVPLHPKYTLSWSDISNEQLKELYLAVKGLSPEDNLLLPVSIKRTLEDIYLEHTIENGKIKLSPENHRLLLLSLGLNKETKEVDWSRPTLEILKELTGITIKSKYPTYIGSRMGRPEKAKERAMNGKPNVLFPTSNTKLRNITDAYRMIKENRKNRLIKVDVARFHCPSCDTTTLYPKCHRCSSKTNREYICANKSCGTITKDTKHCGRPVLRSEQRQIDLVEYYDHARTESTHSPTALKGVGGLFSDEKIPERLSKGFLREKHNLYVYKDGTCRFDATNAPITHFRISEINQTPEGIKALGYQKDINGKDITSSDQIVPLMVQDIIVSERALDYLYRIANFIDDLLVNLYNMEPYYNLKRKEDIFGHLIVGLSPHTSAGVLGRVVGSVKVNVGYAHPYFHCAKRRNCDSDEDAIMLLLDVLINFSKKNLSSKRGGTMDAPILITPKIDPSEVDDEVHSMEVVDHYPLEFYRAAERMVFPGDVKVKTVADILGTEEEYNDLHFTHDTEDINLGPKVTKYVQLDSVPEKVDAEKNLHNMLRMVDSKDAAKRLILSHFIPDLYGNLRKYMRQSFRCSQCNEKYRRIPLYGKCIKCGGKIIPTIHEGGIKKYLSDIKKLIEEYKLEGYMQERIKLVEEEIKSVFVNESMHQYTLSDFF